MSRRRDVIGLISAHRCSKRLNEPAPTADRGARERSAHQDVGSSPGRSPISPPSVGSSYGSSPNSPPWDGSSPGPAPPPCVGSSPGPMPGSDVGSSPGPVPPPRVGSSLSVISPPFGLGTLLRAIARNTGLQCVVYHPAPDLTTGGGTFCENPARSDRALRRRRTVLLGAHGAHSRCRGGTFDGRGAKADDLDGVARLA